MTRGKWLKQTAWLFALALVLPLSVSGAEERERGVGDVVYVPTPQIVVDEMLKMAKVGADDYVIDLGSGDGRIVIAAAKSNPRVQGIGVDIDAKLVDDATEEAKKEGVQRQVRFQQRNAFDADLSKVDVIFMWLWTEVQRMLRTKIGAPLPPLDCFLLMRGLRTV